MRKEGYKGKIILCCVLLFILLSLIGLYLYLVNAYQVQTVYVEGNIHYTEEEIKEMIMGGRYGNNSLYLSIKYKHKKIENVPFVQTCEVTVVDKKTIRIHVYEKSLAGYIEYIGTYFYFDRDGMVVESSKVKTAGIPQVMGLKFGSVVLNDYLPIEDKTVFQTILTVTQALEKYSLSSDKLYFDSKGALTIYFGDVKVKMGDLETLDDKCAILVEILPKMEGKSGVLTMENMSSITFKSNVAETQETQETSDTSIQQE